jgi:tRNA (cmo5U34)-methyltransferase
MLYFLLHPGVPGPTILPTSENAMSDTKNTYWNQSDFAESYLDNADIFIIERARMLKVMQSFYLHFFSQRPNKQVLDLGCGDGVLTRALLAVDKSLTPTLIDGSDKMLKQAKLRLQTATQARFIQSSFQALLFSDNFKHNFDLTVSSLAIHHLTAQEKSNLFSWVHQRLNPDGWFVNVDVTLAPNATLEDWYLIMWDEWITERKESLIIHSFDSDDIISRYKDSEENKPDTLDDQLQALKQCGFQDVDCFYKYGIFTIYGGRKAAE